MSDNTNTISPIYMYAGGKSKLISKYQSIWPNMADYTDYCEPFFGGGAIWGWLAGNYGSLNLHIGDINVELIQMLSFLKEDPELFIQQVTHLSNNYLRIKEADRKLWYYEQRKKYWQKPNSATLFVLMRLGFNGIWQTCKDSNGLFGTPAGLLNHKKLEQIFKESEIRKWSSALQRTKTINATSYEAMYVPAGTSTLVYLDPPYRDSYTTYGTGFSDDDQKVLVEWIRGLVKSGNKVLFANRCVEGDTFFEDLIGSEFDFHYFDVTYTAGRRKLVETGHEAKKAREFLAISK